MFHSVLAALLLKGVFFSSERQGLQIVVCNLNFGIPRWDAG